MSSRAQLIIVSALLLLGYSSDAAGLTTSVSSPLKQQTRIFNAKNKNTAARKQLREMKTCSWTQVGRDIDGEAAYDWSGHSVALSADGTTMAVGARYNNGNGPWSGHVRVYKRKAQAEWVQIGNDIDGEAARDHFGSSVSLSADGTVLAIGAPNNGGNGDFSGHVRVFKFDDSIGWTQVGDDIDGEAARDFSGDSVSLSADGAILAIGADENDGNGYASGHVRVFKFIDNTGWAQVGDDIDGVAAFDQCGYSVSLSADGTILAVGSRYNDGNGSVNGHVRVFKFENNSGWTQMGGDIDGEAVGDKSGASISLSANGAVLAIGARLNDGNGSNSGHVRVFRFIDNTDWTQVGGDIDGEAEGDWSGISVSLSADGTILAIGAEQNDGNGAESGHVRIFKLDDSTVWTQIGEDIDGEASEDLSGRSVSLSAGGTVVAIGALFNDGNMDESGHVRVYEFCFQGTPAVDTVSPDSKSPDLESDAGEGNNVAVAEGNTIAGEGNTSSASLPIVSFMVSTALHLFATVLVVIVAC